MDEKLRCVSCGDVIGAYEPLVALREGWARSTSKAAEADDGPLGECYHSVCYQSRHGEPDE
jgi:hypothetical protein